LTSEKPSLLQIIFSLLVASGAILLSLDLSLGWSEEKNILGVIINLCSSFFSGAMTVLLRKICIKTESLKMSVIEITMFKMLISSLFILIPSIILETILTHPNFWQSIISQWGMSFLIVAGVLITLAYQSSVVALTSQSKAISVGTLHQFIILPQIVIYTLLNLLNIVPKQWNLQSFSSTPSQISGTVVIIIGTISYGSLRLYEHFKKNRNESTNEIELQNVN